MIVAIIILSILLAGAAALIFCLWQVLKNTYLNTYLAETTIERKPMHLAKAYNGVYYPAHVIAKIEFGSPHEMKIADFSMYDKYKIVGMTIYTKETLEDYYGADLMKEISEIDEDLIEELTKPVLMKDKLVFETSEGCWSWKPQDSLL